MSHQGSPGAEKRRRLLDAAITLMRRTGLSGAGINEIVRESGAPKGNVYHFFPDGKRQIVEEGLARYSERVVAFIDASLSRERRPGQKVEALFDAFAERIEQGAFRHSCPVGTVCLDLDAELEGLRVVVAAAFGEFERAIAAHFPFRNGRRAASFPRLVLTPNEGRLCPRSRGPHEQAVPRGWRMAGRDRGARGEVLSEDSRRRCGHGAHRRDFHPLRHRIGAARPRRRSTR